MPQTSGNAGQTTKKGNAGMAWQAEIPIKEPLKAANGNQGVTLGDINTQHVKVIIPPASFASGTTPVVTVSNPAQAPLMDGSRGIPVGSPVSISVGDQPVRLNNLMQITIRFDKSKLPPGTQADNIWATFWDGKQWEYFRPDKVDLQAGTLTFSTGHMTLFGAAKITVDEQIEKFIHSKTVAEVAQKDVVDEVVNKLSEHAIDSLLKDRLGLKEDAWKYKVSSSLLKDDEWADIAKQAKAIYSNGINQRQEEEVAQLVQTINGFVAKKMVENIDEGVLSGALKKIPGSGDEASKGLEKGVEYFTAGTEAAAYLAEKNYRAAAQIIGGKLADEFKITKVIKASAEIIQYRINVWKDSEIEAAYKAYRDGASTRSAYGYEVEKRNFGDVWEQMRAIDLRLQHDAVEAEIKARIDGGQSPPTPREEELIRAKVRANLEAEFKERAAKDDQVATEEAELKKLMAVFKARGLLDDASGYRYGNDNLEFRMGAVLRMRDRILRDTAGKKVTNEDIADLTASYLSGTRVQGEAAYIALMMKKFGIDLAAKPSPPPPAPATVGLLNKRDTTQYFGTEANPFKVTLGGKITGDPGLRFEGAKWEQYAGLGGQVINRSAGYILVFVYSIPANARKTSLDFEGVVLKVEDPGQKVLRRSFPRDGGTPAQDSTYTWVGWQEGTFSGKPLKALPKDTYGAPWTNGSPVSGKDMVQVDAADNPPWAAAGGVLFNVKYKFDYETIFGPPQGTRETQLPPYRSNAVYGDGVVIKLVRR